MSQAKSNWMLVIGAVATAAIMLPFIVWPPYDELASNAQIVNHFICVITMVLAIYLPVVYVSLRASVTSGNNLNEIISSGYFLTLNGMLAVLFLWATYSLIGYPLYWVLTLVQIAVFAGLVFVGASVAESAQSEKQNIQVSNIRRESVVANLRQVQDTLIDVNNDKQKSLKAVCHDLMEELRYFPMAVSVSSHDEPFSKIIRWTQRVKSYLEAHQNTPVDGQEFIELVNSGKTLVRSMAGFKKY
jgi:hypothetical protein